LGSLFQGCACESVITFRQQAEEQWMSGELGLYQNFTWPRSTASAACDLNYRLRQALGCAEVGAEKALVSIQNYDQSYIGKIVPLGHHLRTNQYARLT
jgi:hypothetical protein